MTIRNRMETHGKRIEPRAHRQHDWKVDEIAPDFALIDAWMLPLVGRQADVAEVRAMFREWDPASAAAFATSPAPARTEVAT